MSTADAVEFCSDVAKKGSYLDLLWVLADKSDDGGGGGGSDESLMQLNFCRHYSERYPQCNM